MGCHVRDITAVKMREQRTTDKCLLSLILFTFPTLIQTRMHCLRNGATYRQHIFPAQACSVPGGSRRRSLVGLNMDLQDEKQFLSVLFLHFVLQQVLVNVHLGIIWALFRSLSLLNFIITLGCFYLIPKTRKWFLVKATKPLHFTNFKSLYGNNPILILDYAKKSLSCKNILRRVYGTGVPLIFSTTRIRLLTFPNSLKVCIATQNHDSINAFMDMESLYINMLSWNSLYR